MHTLLDLMFGDETHPAQPLLYATILAVLVGSIVLHEIGHALAATWEGDPTPKIRGHLTWNPVVHMGWVSLILIAVMGIGWGSTPVTRSMFRHRRWGAVLVSFAGPAVNLFLAVVGGVVTILAAGHRGAVDGHIVTFWFVLLRFNVLLIHFNMLPIPPLDGFSVVDGTFDLGNLGETVRRAGMLPLILAILIVNSDAFDVVSGAVVTAILKGAYAVVGA